MPEPRILHVIPTLSTRFGGPTTTAVNGVIAENQAGLRSEIATTIEPDGPGTSQAPLDRLLAAGIRTRLFPRVDRSESSETWGVSPALAVWLLRNTKNYDIVHLQYVWCMTSLVGCMAATLAGVPVVVTPHESLTSYDIETASRGRAKRLLKKVLRRYYLRLVDRIIFMSRLEDLDTCSGETKTILISHAVCESASPPQPPRDGGGRSPLRVGFLGRNIHKKGIDRLLRALAREPGADWRLTIAGPSGTAEFKAEHELLCRSLGVGDRVHWLGFVSDRAALFSNCDVLAMPSEYEGFGMVAAEAMSHGLPVIVPHRSGVAEIVEEFGAGIVTAEPEVEQLTAALLEFDGDRGIWPTYSLNGLRAVEQRLTYRAHAAAVTELYKTLG